MRSRVFVALAALTLSLLLPAGVGAGSAQSAAKAEQDRIIAYWTPARIASAQPRDFVRNDAGKLVPSKGKPGGGGDGDGGAVTGASWTGNEPVELRVGRILFSSGGSNWICSGSVVSDSDTDYSVILTAGHCVFDGNDGWSYNFLFMPDFDDNPDYNCVTRVMGCWTANRLSAHTNFVPSGFGPDSALRVDYGFARVGTGNKLGQLDTAVTGGYGLTTSIGSPGPVAWAFGYPAQGKYKGKDLIYCTGATVGDPYDVGTWGMACKMNGGSSGGGWLFGTTNPADGSGSLGSVNSYGYTGLAYMFGPIFDGDTLDVRDAVVNGNGPNSVVCNVGTQPPNNCPN
ncbi:MAG TPA: hypothetical protein VMQ65_02560 [Candidatus Limnocylindria bacterium]|nr:hypothetical protein [Candidatus Limnocylindria bacterium]